jgi:hypothetical protein
MSSNIENCEERRQKAIADKVRRERMVWRDKVIDLNKDEWVKEVFVQFFVDVLRDVNRKQPSGKAVLQLASFFDLSERGAKITLGSLTDAALARIKPSGERGFGVDEKSNRERALLDIALAGLAVLVENGATDQNARGRKDQREHKLRMAIREYAEHYEMYAARRRASEISHVAAHAGQRTRLALAHPTWRCANCIGFQGGAKAGDASAQGRKEAAFANPDQRGVRRCPS